ncbi:MAG TPA: hypothetical protein VFQ72_02680 [Candidatus Paceibacterota bacterium]|nr:hypothetical protein [Candidatus Paceibacterota bacterium]
MSPFYVRPFVWLLRSQDSLGSIRKAGIEVILAASYSAKSQTELAAATRANLDLAIRLQKTVCPKALICFASCAHPFNDAGYFERRMKEDVCDVASARYAYIGSIVNSITEMEALKGHLLRHSFHPEKMLVVTGELHSESERILARQVFPSAQVYVTCTSHELEVEPDHPTLDQRSWARWLWCSVLRWTAFKAMAAGFVSIDTLRTRQHAPGER